MPWPVHPTGFFGARGDNDTYRIERSLRFNSADSAYLNRTPASAGNRKIYTYSCWVKRTNISATGYAYPITVGPNSNNATVLAFSETGSVQGDSTLSFWEIQGGSYTFRLVTNAVYRDTSSWYHIVVSVDTTQSTASNRIKVYVNGQEITSFSISTYPSLNLDCLTNSTNAHIIGAYSESRFRYSDKYITECNFIDGQALTPSSFGETDPITGRWKAKAYSGTYGTNGFYLKFADNSGTTATTLGKDSSGNGNNWTPNNFSVTAGAGNDSLVDSPTNYGTDTGVGGEVRGNYATLNTLDKGGSINTPTNGNLDIASNTTGYGGIRGIIGVSSGKWYWEFESTSAYNELGICSNQTDLSTYVAASSSGYVYVSSSGNKANNGAYSSYGSTFTSGDTIGIAFNADSGSIEFYKNNVSQGVAFSSIPSGTYFPAHSDDWGSAAIGGSYNFGQRPFKYTAPTGFKALCTTNLPQPTIQKPSKYMDVVAYTGTGASNSISSLGFSPDLVWIKNRGAATSHAIYDTTMGAQNQLSSDTTGDAVTSSTGLTAFSSNGFTVGTSSLVNTSGTQYVAWSWDEAPIAGMDIVSYTGNGANRTIAHNLGVAPKMIIAKARTTAGADQGWPVYHASLANTQYLMLNTTAAAATGADYWNSATPTSSVFSLGTNAAVNLNNDTYIAYLFAEVEGFSKFGSYTGNGSADGPFVWCGFRPRWVMMKRIDASGKPWCIHDAARDIQNVSNSELEANSATAENGGTYPGDLDILSNGFKLREGSSSWINESGTFIFAAFAESPFKYARAR